MQSLPAAQQSNIAGVAFFGYTKNAQTMGMLPGFPSNKLLSQCRSDDGVCGGQLQVTSGHLAYMNDGSIQTAANFLMQQAGAAGASTTAATN